MKIVLEFDGWEERTEALQAQHAVDYIVALDKIREEVRRRWKWMDYDHEETGAEVDSIYKFICDTILELPEYEL